MPKIIENLPQKLSEEARRQILESGYSTLTIRSVAKGCGVGVGTVYNYYASKEELVAALMLEDWRECMAAILECGKTAQGREPVLWAIYENLNLFLQKHEKIFKDEAATAGFSGGVSKYHALLRSQLAAPLKPFCRDDFAAEFIAEAMLTWTVAGKEFEDLNGILQNIDERRPENVQF